MTPLSRTKLIGLAAATALAALTAAGAPAYAEDPAHQSRTRRSA